MIRRFAPHRLLSVPLSFFSLTLVIAGTKIIVSSPSQLPFNHLLGVHTLSSPKLEIAVTLKSFVPPPPVEPMQSLLGGAGGWCVGDYVALSELVERGRRMISAKLAREGVVCDVTTIRESKLYREAVRKYGGRPKRFQRGVVGEITFPDLFEGGDDCTDIYCDFANVYGCDNVIKEINRRVVEPWLRHNSNSNDSNHNNNLNGPPPSGLLLFGPPGTAKTKIAQLTSSFLRLPTITIKSTDVLSKWVGGSELLIRRLFQTARDLSVSCGGGAVIFFDDIDSITVNRDDAEDDEVGGR